MSLILISLEKIDLVSSMPVELRASGFIGSVGGLGCC